MAGEAFLQSYTDPDTCFTAKTYSTMLWLGQHESNADLGVFQKCCKECLHHSLGLGHEPASPCHYSNGEIGELYSLKFVRIVPIVMYVVVPSTPNLSCY